MPPTTARRRDGSAEWFRCNGISAMSACCTRRPANCCGNTCLKCAGSHRIKDEDRPKQTPPGTQHLLRRADRAGQQIGALCRRMYRRAGANRSAPHSGRAGAGQEVRPGDGGRCLRRGPGNRRVQLLPFVRRYLERGPQLPLSLRQVDPLIRATHLISRLHSKQNQQENQP